MNTMSPDQKRRAALAAFIARDPQNFRIAKQELFAKTRLGTKGLTRAEVATRLMRLGVNARDLEIIRGED